MQIFTDTLGLQTTETLIGLRNQIQEILDNRAQSVAFKLDPNPPNKVQAVLAIRKATGMRLLDAKNALENGDTIVIPSNHLMRLHDVMNYGTPEDTHSLIFIDLESP